MQTDTKRALQLACIVAVCATGWLWWWWIRMHGWRRVKKGGG